MSNLRTRTPRRVTPLNSSAIDCWHCQLMRCTQRRSVTLLLDPFSFYNIINITDYAVRVKSSMNCEPCVAPRQNASDLRVVRADAHQCIVVYAALTRFPFQFHLNITRLNIKQVRRVCAASKAVIMLRGGNVKGEGGGGGAVGEV